MQTFAPFGPLAGALVVMFLWPLVHGILAVPPSEGELLLLSYVPSVFVMLWAIGDAQHRRCTPFFDFGLLIWYLFPLSLLGYLVWTRGWRGLAVFVALLAAIYVPWVISNVLAFATL